MQRHSRVSASILAAAAASTLWLAAAAAQDKDDKARRPSLSLRAHPAISFSPARVTATGELRGGADDNEEFYCAAIEWDWGDGTESEQRTDCEPYEAGKSAIRRRFISEHVFQEAGRYQVMLRLKRGSRTLTAANTTVQVRAGLRDPNDPDY